MSKRVPQFRAAVGMTIAAMIMLGSAGSGRAATTCVGFSAFTSLTTAQLMTLQVRVSPLSAISDEPDPALAFTYFSNPLDPTQFKACEAKGLNYTSDLVAPSAFTTSTADLQALITNVGTIPAVVAGGVSSSPLFAFEMYDSQPSPMGFEVVLDKTASAALFAALQSTFANRPDALSLISQKACSPGFLAAGKPTDVSSNVATTLQGVRLKRDTGTFVGNLKLTNNSGGSLTTPLSVVLVTGGHSVFLAHPDGITCAISPVGRGFINIASPPASGNTTTIPVEFLNPDKETITISKVIVLSGPGAR